MQELIFRPHKDGYIRVDGRASCGNLFEKIAVIYDIEGDNPALELPKPLGVSAVTDIMRWIGERKGN